MHAQQNEPDVFEDNTVKTGKSGDGARSPSPISPGPSGSDGSDLSKRDDTSSTGFSTVPGAGPNPTR